VRGNKTNVDRITRYADLGVFVQVGSVCVVGFVNICKFVFLFIFWLIKA